jgi:hypothetical protein
MTRILEIRKSKALGIGSSAMVSINVQGKGKSEGEGEGEGERGRLFTMEDGRGLVRIWYGTGCGTSTHSILGLLLTRRRLGDSQRCANISNVRIVCFKLGSSSNIYVERILVPRKEKRKERKERKKEKRKEKRRREERER